MAKTFTKVDFANSVIALVNGDVELTKELAENMLDKANALLASEANRKAYAETHKTSKAKGAGEKTKALIAELTKVLDKTPKTSAEISKELGRDISALNIANATKYMENVDKTKVVRTTINTKGLKSEKEYTAYFVK